MQDHQAFGVHCLQRSNRQLHMALRGTNTLRGNGLLLRRSTSATRRSQHCGQPSLLGHKNPDQLLLRKPETIASTSVLTHNPMFNIRAQPCSQLRCHLLRGQK